MAIDIKKLLKNANKNWSKAKKRVAKDPGPQFTEIPDGRYTAQLVSAKLGTSESSNRLQAAYGWKIVDGEYEGKTKTAFQGLETEDNLFYAGRDLERLGYELPDDLSDLPEILADLEKTKPVASIFLKTGQGSDFQNVYIRKVFSSDDEDEEAEEEEETDDAEEEETDETEESEESEEESDDEESDEESDDEESDDEEESDEEEEESDEEESDDDADEESDEEESEEEESDDEDEGDEVEITEGMRVQVETTKGREAGKIIEIFEKEEKVRVKLDNGKTVRVGVDKIEVEPEKKATKKPAKKEEKKPAKKAAPAAKKGPAKKPAPATKKKTKK